MDVPDFTDEGVLPVGDYLLSLAELNTSKLVLGPGDPKDHPTWDAAWRQRLVENLSILVGQLWQVGVNEIFVDGSFAEDKDHPNDIDGYFVCNLMRFVTGNLSRDLNLIDPYKVWTWDSSSRRPFTGYPKLQLPMWHQYRVELYPHFGQPSGIKDRHGNDLEFPSAFRRRRVDGTQKGIVKVVGP